MQTIPWFDLSRQYQTLRPEILQSLDTLFQEGGFILGPAVEAFEQGFARYIGVKHCIGLNSGTSALHLALLACGVGQGDEVLTVSATWISTSWAISYVGARPVFVDIEPDTFCMDPALIEKAITPKTKAIIPVHLYGQPSAMAEIRKIADKHGLVVIEDACQAHGAELHGQRMGTFGKVGCFSYYPGKNLGAFGEAGAAVTDDDAIAERIRQLRNHAQAQRHVHVEIGFNMRMEGVQGAILKIKLPYLNQWTEARRRIAAEYQWAWAGLRSLQLPKERTEGKHVYHIFSVRVADRDGFQKYLAKAGVQTTVHYPTPVHLQPAYRDLGYRPGDFPATEALFRQQVTMPMFPEMTDAEIARVIDAVHSWARHQSPSLAA